MMVAIAMSDIEILRAVAILERRSSIYAVSD